MGQLSVAILTLLFIYSSLPSKIPQGDSNAGLNTIEIINKYGYPCESHSIQTEDGYILIYHRIPYGLNGNAEEKRPAVLLMHGLGSSSADYMNMGTNRSLAFLLSEQGYDVWLANARGTSWSRNHTTFNIEVDKEEFFDFSWHEIGYYDIAAAIDYILTLNGDENLHYVAHSQGTTAFFVLISTRPEYNAKIKLASLMAPAVNFDNISSDILRVITKYIDQIEQLAHDLHIYEIPFIDIIQKLGKKLCVMSEFFGICKAIIFEFAGYDDQQFDKDLIPVLFTNGPSNTAVKQLIHFGQQLRSASFAQFDYGYEKNLQIYGSEKPPSYDLSRISLPVALYYGRNDGLVNYLDIPKVIQALPNVVDSYLVRYDLFNHLDFIFAKDVVDLLYNNIIKVMLKF